MSEERERLAVSLGLQKFALMFPEAFDRALADARRLHEQAPRPEAVSDEPAHAYRTEPNGAK